jgi:urease accessory protein
MPTMPPSLLTAMELRAGHSSRIHAMQRGVTGLVRGRFEQINRKTVLLERFHLAPLKVSKTFYLEDDGQLAVYLMDASPGMLDGDSYDVDIRLGRGCSVYLTNQSFTKIHPSSGSIASLRQTFVLDENAVLEYFPEPVIPYAGSRFSGNTEFHLDRGASLLFSEIVTPGRTHRGEHFQYDLLSNQLRVYKQGRLVAWEHFRLEPALDSYSQLGAFENYTHMGAMWVISEEVNEKLLEEMRSCASRLMEPYRQGDTVRGAAVNPLVGMSLTAKEGIAVRLLGHNVWQLQEVIKALWDCCRLHILRKPPLRERK